MYTHPSIYSHTHIRIRLHPDYRVHSDTAGLEEYRKDKERLIKKFRKLEKGAKEGEQWEKTTKEKDGEVKRQRKK